jgi:glycosyltransferase involved in cell wall biosynthesis
VRGRGVRGAIGAHVRGFVDDRGTVIVSSYPRILHVAQPTEAGVAAYVATAAADQMTRGWEVVVACPDGGRLAGDMAARGVPWLSWQASRSPGRNIPAEVRGLARLVREVRPDVVHLHSSKAGLAGRLAIRSRIPTLFQPHGWSWLATSGPLTHAVVAWERIAARWTDYFVCVGEGEAQQGHDRGVAGSFAIVRNGVDPIRFAVADDDARRQARRELGLPEQVPLAVCAGRLTRQKGQDMLLGAWPHVTRRLPDAHLVLVGDGDLLPVLRTRAPDQVLFSPGVSDVRPWYAAADVVVIPSRWEGLSLTLLEAMAIGRSVVVNDIPGLTEVVPDQAGERVRMGDCAGLADAIARRLGDPAMAAAEGHAAARHIRSEFDHRTTLDQLAEVTSAVARRAGDPLRRDDA